MKLKVCMLLGLQYDPKMQIPPDIGIPSYITTFGHDVTWILPSNKIKEVQETTSNGIHIFVVPHRHIGGFFRVIGTALYVSKQLIFLSKNFKQNNYNLIFVRRGSIFNELLALYLKKRYDIPLIVEVENPIEQTWETRKFYSKHRYFWYFISKIEAGIRIHILHKADLVLPISKWLKEDFAKKGVDRSKMMPLPEGIDPNRFLDANGGKIRKRYELEDSKVVVYIGTMDKLRQLDVLIHAFSKVIENNKRVKLLMVGDGTGKSNLEKLANDLGIKDDVIFTSQVYFHEVPNFITTADVGVSPVPPLDFYKLSSPIKMFEYMAMGKPVVANEEILEQEEVIHESGGGVLVKFEVESFADGIIELLDNQKMAKEMGRKGREWVLKNRSYEMMARDLEKRYYELLDESKMGG